VAQPLTLPEHRATVLIVEDDDSLRHLVARVLWEVGYRTVEARNAREALHLAELSTRFADLVITDVMMPEMDGRELGRRLAEKWPTLPVLYISAYDAQDIFHRGAPSRGAPFLQKPFAPEVLLAKVRELLGARRPAA
jgi:two-component system, cell cycle sensor histidine kinase and response regulator CckA